MTYLVLIKQWCGWAQAIQRSWKAGFSFRAAKFPRLPADHRISWTPVRLQDCLIVPLKHPLHVGTLLFHAISLLCLFGEELEVKEGPNRLDWRQ